MKNDKIAKATLDKIANVTGYPGEQIALIRDIIAKKTTLTELTYFLSVEKSTNLNPFLKEIWCYKDNKNNLIVFAGRDGFLKSAQKHPNWNGMSSSVVRENDIFRMNISEGKITHEITGKDRGKILGAYAIVKQKGCELPTVEWASFSIYNKGYNVWKSDPESMILKVAESHALKKAFGITGIQTEYDFDVRNEIAEPVEKEQTEMDIIIQKLISALDSYEGKDRDELKRQCAEKTAKDEFTLEFAESIFKKIKGKQ